MSDMPAEPRQKICKYCGTPADIMAAQCSNCGSALPMAVPLPLPVARMVEAQSKWSMGKTAFVTVLTSLLLGVAFNIDAFNPVLIGVLTGFWMLFFMPGMLLVSAFVHAKGDISRMALNLILATGLWMLGFLISLVSLLMY